jgi:WD40 repeat protein
MMLWDLATHGAVQEAYGHNHEPRRVRQPLQIIVSLGPSLHTIAVTLDDTRVVTAANSSLMLWEVESGQVLHTFGGYSIPVNSAAITPDGQELITGDASGAIIIWDVSRGISLRTLRHPRQRRGVPVGHDTGIQTVVLTPSGEQMISVDDDGTLFLWQLPPHLFAPAPELALDDTAATVTV